MDFGNGRFVAAINNGGQLYTSTDTLTWEPVEDASSPGGYVVEAGRGLWIASGQANAYLTSTDGVTFAPTTPIDRKSGGAGRFAGGRFVLVGPDFVHNPAQELMIEATTDGVTWAPFGAMPLPAVTETGTGAGITPAVQDVAFGACTYVAAGEVVLSHPIVAGQPWLVDHVPYLAVGRAKEAP